MLVRTIGVVAALSLCGLQPAAAQAPPAPAAPAKDHGTAIKENLQKSLAALRQYQWVETTVVSSSRLLANVSASNTIASPRSVGPASVNPRDTSSRRSPSNSSSDKTSMS